jgi:hypothetical protein
VAEAEMEDRRENQRFNVADGITGRIKPTMNVRILDISERGILIESPSGLLPAAMCEVTVNAPSGRHVLRASVARCRAHMVKGDGGKVSILFHAGLEFEQSVNTSEIRELMVEICILDDTASTQPIATVGLEQAM